MSQLIDKKQKLLVEYLISDKETFVKCFRITKPKYFEKPLDRAVEFIMDYFEEYHGIPKIDVIEVETDIELKSREMDIDDRSYFLEEYETFCREREMIITILESVDLIEEGQLELVAEKTREALMVRLDNSVGIDIYENPEERIRNTDLYSDERSTGIIPIDILTGKIRRKELGVIYGTSGSGKSVTLANLAKQLSSQGLEGIIISLELREDLYAKRLDSILTLTDIAEHKQNAAKIAKMYECMAKTTGRIVTKFMPYGTTCSQIRTVIMEYVLKYQKNPDFIIVDYLALMGVDGVSARQASDKHSMDEKKSFGLRNIGDEFNAYMFTAGQINREGQDVMKVSASHVAGGISAVNASDWAIAMVANEEMIDNDEFQVIQLKVRNGGKTRKPITMYRNPTTLEIADKPFVNVKKVPYLNKTESKPDQSSSKSGRDKLRDAIKLR